MHNKNNEAIEIFLDKYKIPLAVVTIFIIIVDILSLTVPLVMDISKKYPNIDGIITALSVISFLFWIVISVMIFTSYTKKIYKHIIALENDKISYYIKDLHKNVIAMKNEQSSYIEILKPKNIHDFHKAFGNAIRIRAYNPPLTLLTREKEHRDLIYSLLKNGAEYNMIIGKELKDRVISLRNLWLNEYGDISLLKMHILPYYHEQDLHTKVKGWNLNEHQDLRGLSFFLIEYKHSSTKSILLYLFGEPFVKDFEVPQTAIRVKSLSGKCELYDKFVETFDARWSKLRGIYDTCGGNLPKICDEDWISFNCNTIN